MIQHDRFVSLDKMIVPHSAFSGKLKLCAQHALLYLVCATGDWLQSPNFQLPSYLRALLDNLTHGGIAAVSWIIVVDDSSKYLEIVVCGLMSCAVDVDHFLAARSFKLNDALNLSHRPPFHNTLLLALVSTGVHFIAWISGSVQWQRYSWLFVVAWLSHHIRDACRRGLWLGDLGSVPYPYWLYIVSVLVLPLTVRTCLYYLDLNVRDVMVPHDVLLQRV